MSTEIKSPEPIQCEVETISLSDLVDRLGKENRDLRQRNRELEEIVKALSDQNFALESRIKDLEAKASKNSSNSSKPPSSDGLKKPPKTTSQRRKSGKKPGGQKGHKGSTLRQVLNPDITVVYSPSSCPDCDTDLSEVASDRSEKRQVFDVPEPKIEVTEHQAEAKTCPCCGLSVKAAFPEKVTAPAQYGERVQALAVYFQHQHFIPFDRTSQIFNEIFGVTTSPGTCSRINQKLFDNLEPFETGLKTSLLATRVLHFDETGMRCGKKLYWVHIASSAKATFYGIHSKRGQIAIDEFGILPQFQGIAVHDHWHPYFTYEQATHSLCNAHHLRELTYVHENEKEDWAGKILKVLLRANETVERYVDQGMLPEDVQQQIEREYAQILIEGFAYHKKLSPLPKGKRGRQKQRVGKNLLDRLSGKQDCVLRFIYDFSVPFTNNQGEQDARMAKIKQKVSGCFRQFNGGKIFCRIRSYLSTARKQGWKIWDTLVEAINGSPRLLPVVPV
jgi:transposase